MGGDHVDVFETAAPPDGPMMGFDDPAGTRSYTVDAANQLTSVTSNAGSGSFVYDEAGRLTEAVDPDGTRRTFTYDKRGLLIQEVVTAGLGGSQVDHCAAAVPTIEGTDGPDTLVGTDGDDVIFAGAGDDIIDAGAGDDLVCAGDGNDQVTGGNGQDILLGQAGDDTLEGGNEVDVLFGGDGNDQLTGVNGNDSLFGEAGDDTLIGDKGNDYLQGGPEADAIDGGKGDDQCEPEPGRIACEVDLESGDPEVTVITRSYTVDGFLSQVTFTRPDTTVDVYELVWDLALPVPQVISLTVNGETTNLVYGTNRSLAIDEAGAATGFEHSVLGDTISGFGSVGSEFDPYGTPDSDELTVGFGYRGELHVGDLIYLRIRDLDPATGRFTTPDPIDGQPGTTTIANQYPYANNNPIGNIDPFGLRAGDQSFEPGQLIS